MAWSEATSQVPILPLSLMPKLQACLPDVTHVTLSPRPFPPPFLHTASDQKPDGGNSLGERVTCMTSGRHEGFGHETQGEYGYLGCSLAPGHSCLQFLITCSMQKWRGKAWEKKLHEGKEAGYLWRYLTVGIAIDSYH